VSILIDKNTKLLVQGITGRDGSFHARAMRDYGTNVVGGVTPGKGGEKLDEMPIFNSVSEAVKATGANTSVIYVRAPFAPDAILEAASAGIELVVCISEGVPAIEMARVTKAIASMGTRVIGPNSPGLISPGKSKVGIMPGEIHKEGNIGVISRSGTLTYEMVWQLTNSGLGQSTCIGIGGDPIIGTNFMDALKLFKDDPETEGVVIIGEIGGSAEEEAAEYISQEMGKPAIGFIAGRTAPPGKRMGHAGAIISQGKGTAEEKTKALEGCGIPVAKLPSEIGPLMKQVLGK
jgi:succinyl-CoA synthetase alpha subunit